jgi:hypothetical protein
VVENIDIYNDTENTVDFKKIVGLYMKANQKRKQGNESGNEIELQVVEQLIFIYINRNAIIKGSIILHWNEIMNQAYDMCKDLEGGKFVELKVFRRWGLIVIIRIIDAAWPDLAKIEIPELGTKKMLNKKQRELQQIILSTPQSPIFTNIYEVLSPILKNKEIYPDLRKQSVKLALALNDSNADFRANKLKEGLENIDGTKESQVECNLFYDSVIAKIKANEDKKIAKKVMKSETVKTDKESPTTSKTDKKSPSTAVSIY